MDGIGSASSGEATRQVSRPEPESAPEPPPEPEQASATDTTTFSPDVNEPEATSGVPDVGSAWSQAWNGVTGAAQSTWDGATQAAQSTWDGATQAAQSTWDGATQAAQSAWDGATQVVQNVQDWQSEHGATLEQRLYSPPGAAAIDGGAMLEALGQGVRNGSEWLGENTRGILPDAQRGAIVGVGAGAGDLVEGLGTMTATAGRIQVGDQETLRQATDIAVSVGQATVYAQTRYAQATGDLLQATGIEPLSRAGQSMSQVAEGIQQRFVSDEVAQVMGGLEGAQQTYAGRAMSAVSPGGSWLDQQGQSLQANNADNPVVQAIDQAVERRLDEYRNDTEFAVARDASRLAFEVASAVIAPEELLLRGGTAVKGIQATGEAVRLARGAGRLTRGGVDEAAGRAGRVVPGPLPAREPFIDPNPTQVDLPRPNFREPFIDPNPTQVDLPRPNLREPFIDPNPTQVDLPRPNFREPFIDPNPTQVDLPRPNLREPFIDPNPTQVDLPRPDRSGVHLPFDERPTDPSLRLPPEGRLQSPPEPEFPSPTTRYAPPPSADPPGPAMAEQSWRAEQALRQAEQAGNLALWDALASGNSDVLKALPYVVERQQLALLKPDVLQVGERGINVYGARSQRELEDIHRHLEFVHSRVPNSLNALDNLHLTNGLGPHPYLPGQDIPAVYLQPRAPGEASRIVLARDPNGQLHSYTLAHEVGHAVDHHMAPGTSLRSDHGPFGRGDTGEFISPYARNSHQEDYAEVFDHWVHEPWRISHEATARGGNYQRKLEQVQRDVGYLERWGGPVPPPPLPPTAPSEGSRGILRRLFGG